MNSLSSSSCLSMCVWVWACEGMNHKKGVLCWRQKHNLATWIPTWSLCVCLCIWETCLRSSMCVCIEHMHKRVSELEWIFEWMIDNYFLHWNIESECVHWFLTAWPLVLLYFLLCGYCRNNHWRNILHMFNSAYNIEKGHYIAYRPKPACMVIQN